MDLEAQVPKKEDVFFGKITIAEWLWKTAPIEQVKKAIDVECDTLKKDMLLAIRFRRATGIHPPSWEELAAWAQENPE